MAENELAGTDQASPGFAPPRLPTGAAPEVLWVGVAGGMEADLVQRAGVPFETIPAAGVHGVGLRSLPGNLGLLGQGYLRARQILSRFQPQALFFTGGYVAVPLALAGMSVPSLLYVPDIEPGLALKTLARFADRIALTVSDSQAYLRQGDRRKTVVTGYPTRPDLAGWTRQAACAKLELSPDLPVLLVTGGSSGARSINRALLGCLPRLLQDMQVVHLTGRLDWSEVAGARSGLTAEQQSRYRAYPYLYEMGAALAAADLALSRAGASTLGEYPRFGLPAILVPYPYAWRYQQVNASFLADRGAALIIQDDELPDRLLAAVQELMGDRERREKMGQAMREVYQPGAASSIAAALLSLASRHAQERN